MDSTIPLNDNERIAKFYEIMPQEEIIHFSGIKVVSQYFTNLYEKYDNYLHSIPLAFKDKNLKNLQENLRMNLFKFWHFLMLNREEKLEEKAKELETLSNNLWLSYLNLSKSCKSFLDQEHATPKTKKTHTFPHKLPAGTTWGNFIITFSNKENVTIEFRGTRHVTNFADMGFENSKSKKPNRQWQFFYILAELGGEITPKDNKQSPLYKKIKEKLANQLKDYFGLDYDPFYPYHDSSEKSGNSYSIKMTLMVPKTSPQPERTPKMTIEEEIAELLKEEKYEDEFDDSYHNY